MEHAPPPLTHMGDTLPRGRQPSELFCRSFRATEIGLGMPSMVRRPHSEPLTH